MKTDLYTRVMLTIIAICMFILVLQGMLPLTRTQNVRVLNAPVVKLLSSEEKGGKGRVVRVVIVKDDAK